MTSTALRGGVVLRRRQSLWPGRLSSGCSFGRRLEGAKGGKRGLLISLDEHSSQIIRNAGTLGLDLKEQIDADMIHIMYESPQELEVDAHFARIIQTIEEHKIQRLVIEGVTSYSTALDDQR